MPLNMRPLIRSCTLFGLAGMLSACSTLHAPSTPAASHRAPPKLVVFIVIDGLPMRQVTGYRDQLAPEGFRRFLDRGLWFSDAHYGHSYTVTAAGHSVMLSGAYPERSGIIGNEWRDAKTGEPVYCTGDLHHHYIEHKTEPLSGTSPANYRVETVGDVLRTLHPAAKVIGISGKDRGAILPAGHKGTAYMFMSQTGQFASSSYYMQAHPAWVKAFHATQPADAYFGRVWAPLLPDACDPKAPPAPGMACGAYARSVADDQPWQAEAGNGRRLPATLGAGMNGVGPDFYANLLPSPFGDDLTLAFARAAIEGEQLGADDQTDILSISLSSHDYVNHLFGPESRLSHDHTLHLDRYLQAFFQYLDARVGAGNYVALLTADHGFMDTPEWARKQGRDAGRIKPAAFLAQVNEGLRRQLGEGTWVTAWSATGLLFNEALIRERALAPDAVYAAAKTVAEGLDGVAAAFTRAELAGTDTRTPHLAAMRKSWHPEVAAPLQIVVKEGWMLSSYSTGTTHGSPYRYDTHVPLLAYGPRWLAQGEVRQRVEVSDIAPTLAQLIGIPVPKQSQGQVLPIRTHATGTLTQESR